MILRQGFISMRTELILLMLRRILQDADSLRITPGQPIPIVQFKYERVIKRV